MRTLALAPVLLLSVLSLSGCGGTSSAPPSVSPQTPPVTLTGNWLLSGSRAHAVYPVVSASLHVEGNVVTGDASVETQCTGGVLVGVGTSTLPVKGTVAADGTFQASSGTVGDPSVGTFSLTISGTSPSLATPSAWIGNYSFVKASPSATACNVAANATFKAASIAPVTGTFIGSPANPGTFSEPFGSNATVTLEITEGSPVAVTRGGATFYPIPLIANLTVANSPCPFFGSTTSTNTTGSLAGDRLVLPFVTSGAPGEPFVSGALDDPTAASFLGDLTILANGNGCSGVAIYEFTRK